jgi:hypothetical protein
MDVIAGWLTGGEIRLQLSLIFASQPFSKHAVGPYGRRYGQTIYGQLLTYVMSSQW